MSEPPRSGERQAIRFAVVALATGSWLLLMDRLGLALAGWPSWCGAVCMARLASIHVVAGALVCGVVLGARGVLGRLVGWRFYVALAALTCVFLFGTSLVFSLTVRTKTEITKQAFYWPLAAALSVVGAAIVVAASAFRGRTWFVALPLVLSALTGFVDATLYPANVPEAHLFFHAVEAATACLGVGLPAANALSAAKHARVALALVALALAGSADTWFRARGPVGNASHVVRRLFLSLPKRPPAEAVTWALEVPLRRRLPQGASRSPGARRSFSVLLATVDSLRADAVFAAPKRGAYLRGGETPFLDAWLPRTTRFVHAYSSGPVTRESMPFLLHGIGAGDALGGADVPVLARSIGASTLAVVPSFFAFDGEYDARVDAFDRTEHYDLTKQWTQLDTLEKALSELEGERFFAWTHFYCTHWPYCKEGRPQSEGLLWPHEVVRIDREYRESVKYLDSQMARMVTLLQRLNRADSTIVVLASDHGEHVGEGLFMGHGDALHELDVRVPLAFYVPGRAGAEIRTAVSNGRILPTVLDLLGEPPSKAHVERSLTLETAAPTPPPEPVYVKGATAHQHVLVSPERVLLYDEASGAFSWHSRVTGVIDGTPGDPPPAEASEHREVAALVRANPAPFLAAPLTPRTAELLRSRLLEVNGDTSSEDVDFLVRLAGSLKDPSLEPALSRAFGALPLPEQKARMAMLLDAGGEPSFVGRLAEVLAADSGTPREIPTLEALAAYHAVRVLSLGGVGNRPAALAEGDDPALKAAWLALFASGPGGGALLPVLRNLVRVAAPTAEPDGLVQNALRAIESLELTPVERASADARELTGWVVEKLGSADRRVRLAACRALGKVGTPELSAALGRLLEVERSEGVRLAAMVARSRVLSPRTAERSTPRARASATDRPR